MTQSAGRPVLYCVALLTLGAAISPLSRLQLTPIYGELSVSACYPTLHYVALVLGLFILPVTCGEHAAQFVPLFAWCVVSSRRIDALRLFGLQPLEADYGPIMAEAISSTPAISLLIFHVYNRLRTSKIFSRLSVSWQHTLSRVVIAAYYALVQRGITAFLPLHFANGHFFTSRASLYLAICVAITVLVLRKPASRRKALIGVLSISILLSSTSLLAHPLITSLPTKFALRQTNGRLSPHGWKVLERGEGVTGYVSVLENSEAQYRLMRCDHSLLGGEWLLTAERKMREGWTSEEPVFGVFTMLEAVRLVKGLPAPQAQHTALVM